MRYQLWNDGDGHLYCVPVQRMDVILELERTPYELDPERWVTLFSSLEDDLIRVEGCLTFENPRTDGE